MIQPIAGVVAAEVKEVTIMTVWPSNAAYRVGRLLGRGYAIQAGFYIFTVGNLIALLSIPIALPIYFYRVAPFVGTRYRLTNRRIIIQTGLAGKDDRWVDLDRFDRIELVQLPGQAWYDAGDLVFSKAGVETFRLPGVSRPEAFRNVCMKAHQAHMGVKAALARMKPAAPAHD